MALLLGVCLTGCASSGGPRPEPPKPPPVELVGSRWALVSLTGMPPRSDEPLLLELQLEGQVSGFAGVNRFSGRYTLPGATLGRGEIRFDQPAATRMAGPETLMDQERRYLDALVSVDAFIAEGGLLELMSAGRPLLRFRQLARSPSAPGVTSSASGP